MLCFPTGEQSAERSLGTSTTCLNTIQDQSLLKEHLFVRDIQSIERRYDVHTLLMAVLGQQPTRRFWEEPSSNDKDNSKHTLEGDRKAPCEVVRSVGSAKVNPVGNHRSKCNYPAFDANKETAICGSRTFCLISRNSRSVDSVADSSYRTPDNKLGSSPVTLDRRYLNDDSDDHYKTTKHHLCYVSIFSISSRLSTELTAFLRPRRSPNDKMKIAPIRHPIS